MARAEVVTVWCDQCRKVDLRAPGEIVNIVVGGELVAELDLCERHRAEVLRAIKRALPGRRRPPSAVRRDRRGPFQCKIPGCTAVPLKQDKTLTQHVASFHGLTLAEYKEEYGPLVPMTKAELAALVNEVRCDEDGCDQVYSTATGTRFPRAALVSHMRGTHAIRLLKDGTKEPMLL